MKFRGYFRFKSGIFEIFDQNMILKIGLKLPAKTGGYRVVGVYNRVIHQALQFYTYYSYGQHLESHISSHSLLNVLFLLQIRHCLTDILRVIFGYTGPDMIAS